MADYLDAPLVADPLCRFDCVPLVAGAEAIVLTAADRAPSGARVRAVVTSFNHDQQEGDGLSTGLGDAAGELWRASGVGPEDIDVAAVYDDYPVLVLVQLEELGFIQGGDAGALLRGPDGGTRPAVNTSGGMLSAGQAGAAGGLHGIVECARQLRGRRGEGQVAGARVAVAAASTVAIYRYGACAGAAVLEAAA
jgi:acetyl-CoA acetyltransferase